MQSPAPAFNPSTPPMLVRSRSLHPLNTSPLFPQLASHGAHWHPDALASPYTGPLDPTFSGQTVLYGNAQPGMQILASPQQPLQGSGVAYGAYPPVHLLTQPFAAHAPRVVHRSQSDYGGLRSHMQSSSLMYYPGARDPRRPPSGLPGPWDATREVVLRSPPLPRQRSAKACKKCRVRKTKCSGGLPCSRCSTRGLECEYEDKAALKGPTRSRTETRRKLAARTVSFDESSSDESTPEASRPNTPTDKTPDASGSSDRTERIPSVMRPSSLPSLRVQTSLPAAPVGPAPAMDPTYMSYVVSSPALIDGSLPQGAEMTDDQAASMIQGYTVPFNQECATRTHAHANGIWEQQRTPDSDASDSSRPGSSCSASSHCSSDASGYSQSSDASVSTSVHSMVWPLPMVDFAFPTPGFAPPLSATSSSSSLEGALVAKPLRPATLPTLGAQAPGTAPIATGAPAPGTELAAVLTDILSQSHISETTTETAGAQGPSTPSPAIDSPLSPSQSDWLHDSPVAIGALRFEDVFDLSTASPNSTIRIAPSFGPGLGTSLNSFPFDGEFAHRSPGMTSTLGAAIPA